jgi:hypothetical protein
VQDTQAPKEAADIVGVRGALHQRVGRRAKQDVIEVLLGPPAEFPHLMGHGADDVTVGDRQQCLTHLLRPGLGSLAAACGATTSATGVVAIMRLATVITLPQVPSQDFRAAVEKIFDRPPMAGAQIRPELVQVRTAIALNDSRERRHGRSRRASRSAISALIVAGVRSRVGAVRWV